MTMRQLLPQTETFPYLGVLAQNTDLNNAPNGVCVIGGKYGNA